jgi:single-strand DNA-binding protein
MFNKVILVGNLTRDIELRYLPSGSAVATTGIATNRKFKAQDGTQKEEVCFIDITFFGRTAEIANQYLGRGKKVLVEGRLKLDQWTDQNGGKRSKHSITADTLQMLDSKGSNSGENSNYNQAPQSGGSYSNASQQQNSYNNTQQPQQSYQQQPQTSQHANNEVPVVDIDEDEIPF